MSVKAPLYIFYDFEPSDYIQSKVEKTSNALTSKLFLSFRPSTLQSIDDWLDSKHALSETVILECAKYIQLWTSPSKIMRKLWNSSKTALAKLGVSDVQELHGSLSLDNRTQQQE